MADERRFYRVIGTFDLWRMRLPGHLERGFEEEADFRRALRLLVERWHDRVGECVGERHEFLLLRFHDTPGGVPDEAWIPDYLLEPAPVPEYAVRRDMTSSEEMAEELDRAFGFD